MLLYIAASFFHRGTSSPEPPYTLSRGGPRPRSVRVARFAALTRCEIVGLSSPEPLTRSLAGPPGPAPFAWLASLRSLAARSSDFVPRTPLHALSRGPPAPLRSRGSLRCAH